VEALIEQMRVSIKKEEGAYYLQEEEYFLKVSILTPRVQGGGPG